MANRTKADTIAEVKAIAKVFSILISPDADQTILDSVNATLTYQQAVIRLLCLQVELLNSIKNP